jgi:hypothetical protein
MSVKCDGLNTALVPKYKSNTLIKNKAPQFEGFFICKKSMCSILVSVASVQP